MVMYALAVSALLPLAMAGFLMPQQQNWNNWNSQPQQQNWNNWNSQPQQQNWNNWNSQQQNWNGGSHQNGGGQQNGGQNAWWTMTNSEEYQAYLKWCDERKLALQEQAQQEEMLKEFQEHAEAQERMRAREKAQKEMAMKRESMKAQWMMWKQQLSMSDECDDKVSQLTEMKTKYMFKLTTEFLQFCRCQDYTACLQRYLIYGGMGYQAASVESFNLEELEPVLQSNGVEAEAQRLAAMTQLAQVKAFFGGTIGAMCESVKTYVDSVQAWEAQYNFMALK